MKGLISCFVLLFGLISESNSQDLYASLSQAKGDATSSVILKGLATDYYHFDNVVLPPGYRMKKVGSALTVGGGALFIGGVLLISNASESTYNPNTGYYEPDSELYLGSLMVVGGIGMTVPGIIFWVRGAKKYNRYLENLQGSVNLSGTGLVVSLKF